jgi:hypothetical protein
MIRDRLSIFPINNEDSIAGLKVVAAISHISNKLPSLCSYMVPESAGSRASKALGET